MANPLCTYTGWGSSVTGVLCNASSGNLSVDQRQAIVDQGKADVARAAAGREPSVIAVLQSQIENEINTALTTFKMPGETKEDVGAQPDQSALRVAGTGNITLAKLQEILPGLPNLSNLKYWIAGIAILLVVIYTLPYSVPPIRRAISAVRG